MIDRVTDWLETFQRTDVLNQATHHMTQVRHVEKPFPLHLHSLSTVAGVACVVGADGVEAIRSNRENDLWGKCKLVSNLYEELGS
jgi:hypothetical protein